MLTKILFLALAIVQVSHSLKFPDRKFNTSSLTFPKGFYFSSASAAYQVEGAWNLDGKGENIYDRLTHTTPALFRDNATGDVACDFYHRYKEDVQYMKTIGFQMYRFSISWSRIFPGGFITNPNPIGVKFYDDLIDELLANGIEPMVTMYHWDLPQPLQDLGGWLNPMIADIFAEYCRQLFQLYGQKVKWWITINEGPSIAGGYSGGFFAPHLNFKAYGMYLSGHNLLRAHAKAYKIYNQEFRATQKGKVSFLLNGGALVPNDPNSPHDVNVAETGMQLNLGWFGHPIFSKDGDYHPMMKDVLNKQGCSEFNKKSCLPEFTNEEIEDLKGSSDFLPLNHYCSNLVLDGQVLPNDSPKLPWPKSGCAWLSVYPKGFSDTLRWLRKEYDNPQIFVTENGYCSFADNDNDEARIDYFMGYLNELVTVMNEGSNIMGYTLWGLTDDFEWENGYGRKFGIIKVDFNDPKLPRSYKDSAALFKQIIDQNK